MLLGKAQVVLDGRTITAEVLADDQDFKEHLTGVFSRIKFRTIGHICDSPVNINLIFIA
jgi:hypothetical protein